MVNQFKVKTYDKGFTQHALIQASCFLDLGKPIWGGKIHRVLNQAADSNLNCL